MIPRMARAKNQNPPKSLIIIGLALATWAGAWPAFAQQDPPENAAPAVTAPDTQAQGQPAPPEQQQPPDAQPQGQPDSQVQAQPSQAVPPQTLTIPAGTVIRVRTDEWISSDRNVIGDSFSAVLSEPIVINGWVVARRGQAQTGRVSQVKKGHGGGTSELGLDLPELTLVDGQQLPLQTQLFQASAGPSYGRSAAIVGSTTGMGALIGAIAGRGVGAAIGAGLGATAGAISVMSTPGKPTVVAPESGLSFRLQAPVTISTDNSQVAFQPVTQSDYDSRPSQARPRLARPVPPPPPYPYYGGPYPYPYGWYPAPFLGFGYYRRFGGWR